MPTPHDLGIHHVLSRLRPLGILLDYSSRQRLAAAVNIADLRDCAERRAHKMVFDYMDGGCDDELSLRRNRETYSELELHYGVLCGHAAVDMSTKLFGREVDLPFFCAPTAGQKMFHVDGEAAAATVCADARALYCLSAMATTGISEIARLNPSGPKLLQLYLWKDREIVRDVLQQAKEANFDAIALTGDTPWFGNRERDPRNGFTVPPSYSPIQIGRAILRPSWSFDFLSHEPYSFQLFAGDSKAEALLETMNNKMSKDYSWKDAEWLLSEWGGKSALKGVCRVEDAAAAKATGFDAVWVSNHGGRQLETSPPTVSLLPEMRAAVGEDMELIVDGGIMRGTDILKCLALGADGVGIGRAYLYGLAAGGTPGVRKAFAILRAELERAMGLLGVATIEELKRHGGDAVRWRRLMTHAPGPGHRPW